MAKKRVPLPVTVAAEVLFAADRTCCVCRVRSKPVQVHHIDDDPTNNDIANLAVLCLPCHDATQVRGGFGRKLDAHQVRLYKNDWHSAVRRFRMIGPEPLSSHDATPTLDVRLAATLPEIYKEQEDLHSLISFYDGIGDYAKRDHYIAQVLEDNPEPWVVTWVARLQGRSGDIPPAVFEAALADVGDDYMVESGLLEEAGRPIEAAQAMLRGVMDSLESGNLFNAAYNMNRLGDNDFVEDLFKIALKRAVEADDLWRQLRCYQELGWDTEAKNLLTANAAEIGAGNNLLLRRDLAKATEDAEALFIIEQEIARAGVSAYFVSAKDEDTDDDAE